MAPLTVAMTGDANYTYPLGVAIHSYAMHCTTDVQLEFAAPNDWRSMVREEDLERLSDLADALGWAFDVVECPIDAANLPRTLHISPITFVKPAYFDVARAETCLFIDADSIAVADWTGMVGHIHEMAISAAREDNMAHFERKWSNTLPLGWYINAGMLVCRPDRWRRDYAERWRMLVDTYDEWDFEYLEQDVMNATLLGRADLLPAEYNTRPAYGDPLEGARIIHYAGWWKPWLSTRPLLRTLKSPLNESFSMYAAAEGSFATFVQQALPTDARSFWREARSRVRGAGSNLAYRHYARGRLSHYKRVFGRH